MRIKYISQVDSPPDQVGKVGDEREISDYLGEKLVRTGYAVEVKPKGKTDGSVNPRAASPEAKPKD